MAKKLQTVFFILMTILISSGNMLSANATSCLQDSYSQQMYRSQQIHDSQQMHSGHASCSADSAHIMDCSSGHCSLCFSLLPGPTIAIQNMKVRQIETLLVSVWLSHEFSPELRPPISL